MAFSSLVSHHFFSIWINIVFWITMFYDKWFLLFFFDIVSSDIFISVQANHSGWCGLPCIISITLKPHHTLQEYIYMWRYTIVMAHSRAFECKRMLQGLSGLLSPTRQYDKAGQWAVGETILYTCARMAETNTLNNSPV